MKAHCLVLSLAFGAATLLHAQDLPTVASRNDAEAQQRAAQTSTPAAASPTYRGTTGRAAERAYRADKAARQRHKEDNVIHGTNLPGGYYITPDGTWMNPDGTVAAESRETAKERAKRLKGTEKLRRKHARQDRKAGRKPD